MDFHSLLASNISLPHTLLGIQHKPLASIQHDARIERDVLHAEHDVHGVAELAFAFAFGIGHPDWSLVTGIVWTPLAGREAFAIDAYALVPVSLGVAGCSVLDSGAVVGS
jgi:hypothetical protein